MWPRGVAPRGRSHFLRFATMGVSVMYAGVRLLLLVFWLLALTRPAAAQTWNGNGTDDNWSTAANWSGGVPVTGTNAYVTFAGTNRLNPVQDVTDPLSLQGLTFDSSAGAFTLGGGGLSFTSGTLTQNSYS